MAEPREITAHFTDSRQYFENSLGKEFDFTQSTGPYEYLLGALAGCFYRTLASLDRKSGWKSLTINLKGWKRDTSPTTLKTTALDIAAEGVEDKEEFESLVSKAASLCSIYNTISEVSEMAIGIRYDE